MLSSSLHHYPHLFSPIPCIVSLVLRWHSSDFLFGAVKVKTTKNNEKTFETKFASKRFTRVSFQQFIWIHKQKYHSIVFDVKRTTENQNKIHNLLISDLNVSISCWAFFFSSSSFWIDWVPVFDAAEVFRNNFISFSISPSFFWSSAISLSFAKPLFVTSVGVFDTSRPSFNWLLISLFSCSKSLTLRRSCDDSCSFKSSNTLSSAGSSSSEMPSSLSSDESTVSRDGAVGLSFRPVNQIF